MKITNWQFNQQLDNTETSAIIDGFRLWFRFPTVYPVSRAGDPFLAAALLPAMRQGENIEIDQSLPVSPKLLGNIFQLQEIFHSWNPELKMISVKATTLPAKQVNDGAMSFFSGGVDSMFTFLKHLKEITHVVYIHGFDFYFSKSGSSIFSRDDIKDLGS